MMNSPLLAQSKTVLWTMLLLVESVRLMPAA
jgi:hypothetical protein